MQTVRKYILKLVRLHGHGVQAVHQGWLQRVQLLDALLNERLLEQLALDELLAQVLREALLRHLDDVKRAVDRLVREQPQELT